MPAGEKSIVKERSGAVWRTKGPHESGWVGANLLKDGRLAVLS